MPSIGTLAGRPAGQTVLLQGYVVGSYTCPPCPTGAMCKPCAGPDSILVADRPAHGNQRPPAIVISVPDPAAFPLGAHYRFDLETADKRRDGVDAHLLHAMRLRP